MQSAPTQYQEIGIINYAAEIDTASVFVRWLEIIAICELAAHSPRVPDSCDDIGCDQHQCDSYQHWLIPDRLTDVIHARGYYQAGNFINKHQTQALA